MHKEIRFLAACAAATLLCLSTSSCSRQAKSARSLTKANEHFIAGDFDKAEVEYKNALQADPKNATAYGRLGAIYFDQGRVAQSYGFLHKAIELQPDNLEAQLKLGALHLGIGKTDEARQAAQFVLSRKPQDDDAPIILAEAAAKPQEITEARNRLSSLPAPASTSAPVLVALAVLDLRQGDFTSGEARLEQARALAPKNHAPIMMHARVQLMRKNVTAAEEAFATAAKLSPPRSPARLHYVQFLMQASKRNAAKQQLEEITRQTPDLLPAWVMLADIAMAEKNYDASVTYLNRVLAREPAHPDASLLLARARLAQGESAKSINALEAAVKRYPQAARIHHELGAAYLAAGDMNNAIASLTQAATLAPEVPAPKLLLADINLSQGNYVAAINSVRQLLQQHPQLAEGRLLLANAYRAQGNLTDALKLYRELDGGPRPNAQINHWIGLVLLQQNKKEEAREAFTKSVSAASGYSPALEQLVGLEVTEKHFTAARHRIEAELIKAPNAAPLHILLAKVCIAGADPTQAEMSLRRALELDPAAPAAHVQLAQLYLNTNQEAKAVANLQAAAKKNPKDVGPSMVLGSLLEKKGDYAAARSTYERLIEANPTAAAAFNNLAYIYAEHYGELDKAATAANKARELMPSHPHVADTHGWILFKQQQYARALGSIQQAAGSLPDMAEVQYHLGLTYYMLGDEPRARIALERALQLDSGFSGASQIREHLAVLDIDSSSSATDVISRLEKIVADRASDPVAWKKLGSIHERAGRFEKAAACYEAALKASSGNVAAGLGLVRVENAKENLPKALELAKSLRKIAPNDPRVAHILGKLAYKSGDHRWAVSLLQEAVRSDEGNADLLFDLAEASYTLGDLSSAEEAAKRGLQINATHSRAADVRLFLELTTWGREPTQALRNKGKVEEALKADANQLPALFAMGVISEQHAEVGSAKEYYESALKRAPAFSLAQKRLAILYASDPSVGESALEVANKARQAFPADAEIAKALGLITYRMKNFSRAETLLDEAARQRNDDGDVYYYLGLTRLALNKDRDSRRALERALEAGIRPEFAKDAREKLARLH